MAFIDEFSFSFDRNSKFWFIIVLAIIKTNPFSHHLSKCNQSFKIWTFSAFLYISETTRTNFFKISSNNLHNAYNIQIQPGLKAKLQLINLYFKSNNKLVIHKSVNLRAQVHVTFEGKAKLFQSELIALYVHPKNSKHLRSHYRLGLENKFLENKSGEFFALDRCTLQILANKSGGVLTNVLYFLSYSPRTECGISQFFKTNCTQPILELSFWLGKLGSPNQLEFHRSVCALQNNNNNIAKEKKQQ